MATRAEKKLLARLERKQKEKKAFALPSDVCLEYFHEGRRHIVIAVRYSKENMTEVTIGYAIFRRKEADEVYDKSALRSTALARLEQKPILLDCAPNMSPATKESDEDEYWKGQEEFRDDLWRCVIRAKALRIFGEDDKPELKRFEVLFPDKFSVCEGDGGDGLAALVRAMSRRRRSFLRESLMLHPYKKRVEE